MTRRVHNRRAIVQAELAGTRILWDVLQREMGAVRAGLVLGNVVARLAAQKPFGGLGAPIDDRDRLSRRQLAPAINLYFVLRDQIGSERAIEIVREISMEAGKVFLSKMLVLPADSAKLIAAIPAMIQSFFNAEGESVIGDNYVEFTVSRCRFVELLARVDASELGPIFCEVDKRYFAQASVPVKLRRTTSLATGGSCCDFRFERSP